MQRDFKDRSVQVSVEQHWASDLERFANKDEPSTSSTRIRKVQKIVWVQLCARMPYGTLQCAPHVPSVWGAVALFYLCLAPCRGQVSTLNAQCFRDNLGALDFRARFGIFPLRPPT